MMALDFLISTILVYYFLFAYFCLKKPLNLPKKELACLSFYYSSFAFCLSSFKDYYLGAI